MANKKLHPKVNEFKEFVRKNPQLIKEVRAEKTTWQELFEDWYILGEDDPRWDEYKTSTNSTTNETSDEDSKSNQAFLNNILNSLKKMDMNQVQYYIGQLHDALGTAQNLLTQFQTNATKQEEPKQEPERRPHPFSFFHD